MGRHLSHAVLRSEGPTITTSTKSDLVNPPRGLGALRVLDLLGHVAVPEGARASYVSPLALVSTFEEALLTGHVLMDSAYSFSKSGVTNEAYWTQRAARVVAALLWAAWAAEASARCSVERPVRTVARRWAT